MRCRSLGVLVCALISLTARRAAAQTTSPSPPIAGFENGFFIQSPDGDNRLVIGFVSQMDARFELGDTLPIGSTFAVRKVRPTFSGRVRRYFEFKVMPDLGNGQTTLTDAYVDVRFARGFRIRTGKDKEPIGYELLQGDAYLLFPERALASSLVPNRDVGIQAQGDFWTQRLTYAAGVFNGIPDGTYSSIDTDTNGAKDVAARITIQPFRRTGGGPAGPLTGLGFHLGGSRGTQTDALPSFRTSYGQVYFAYAADAAAQGTHTRVTPAVFYYRRSLGAFAEYIRSAQQVARTGVTTDVDNHAWEVTGSYVLTGEAASDRGVRPRHNFDPSAGEWGAVQVLARYTVLTVDRAAFTDGLADTRASRVARSWTLGVNWYPNPWVKWYATVERTTFEGGSPVARPDENVVFLRFQLGF
ncbi:MAG TPA: porin [Vicinamibacterales bacterium]|nr:porin [Vicinamibacterales bacterium]